MKKTTTAIILTLLCLSMFANLATHTEATSTETPLAVAEKAAQWVMSKAVPESGGFKWLWTHIQTGVQAYNPQINYGAAGIGMFLLELYQMTGNQTFKDYAKGAGDWIISQAVSEAGGYMWADHDYDGTYYLTTQEGGAAGIGEFLLKLYNQTGSSLYLGYAEGAAMLMMSMQTPSGYIYYGVPGGTHVGRESMTATFMLDIAKVTGNDTYAQSAEKSAKWLVNTAVPENGGYKWAHEGQYDIEGPYLAAAFLYDVYESTGNSSYLQYANGAIQWVLTQTVVDGNMAKWPQNQGVAYYPIMDSDSARALGKEFIGDVLLEGYAVTRNSTYLDYANKQAEWIISQGILEGGGIKFPDSEGGSNFWANTNGRVFRFLATMYSATGNKNYPLVAGQALNWIAQNAQEENNGYKWIFYGRYNPGFDGVAGIGYNLISENVPLTPASPQKQLSIELHGEFDYLSWENIKPKIAALVTYANTSGLVSRANVTIQIYGPKYALWVSGNMTEKYPGIYVWESNATAQQIFSRGGSGIYFVNASTSKEGCLNAIGILEFHIDPPAEPTGDNNQLPIVVGGVLAIIAILAVALAFVKKKQHR